MLNGTINNSYKLSGHVLLVHRSISTSNSTVKISNGVLRNGLAGSFGCPTSRTHVTFPEPNMSNVDIQNKRGEIGNKTSTK